MTDERFDHDLKSVLREIAGGEAPMSLRNRVADLIDQAPVSRRLWFAPPLKLSIAAVAMVAVLAIAFILMPRDDVGPLPSASPSEPIATEPASSGEPTASTQPTPTLEPTAVPTPEVVAWTGLDWAPGSVDEGSWWNIDDFLPWGDGYVGVGASTEVDGRTLDPTSPISPAFFTSADGLHWTLVQKDAAIDEGDQGSLPERLVPLGDGLLAIGHSPYPYGAPQLWRSEDGSTWSPLDSAIWRDALATNTLFSVAGGPAGVVAIGAQTMQSSEQPEGQPVVIYSRDGLTWDRRDLAPVFDNAYLLDVAAYRDGFVIVGRVGEPFVESATEPPSGVPAAWTSPDGVTWLAAEVEGAEAPGARLSAVIVGAEGLFAVGHQPETLSTPAQPFPETRSGWASADGQSWRLVGGIGADLPLASRQQGASPPFAGDGTHMVLFGRESCETKVLSAWTSTDGVTWTRLAFSGVSTGRPADPGPICNDDGTEGRIPSPGIWHAVVTPDGVIVVYMAQVGGSAEDAVPPTYWFLKAITQ